MDFREVTEKLFEVAKDQKCKITVEYESGTQVVYHGSDSIKARDDKIAEEKREAYLKLQASREGGVISFGSTVIAEPAGELVNFANNFDATQAAQLSHSLSKGERS